MQGQSPDDRLEGKDFHTDLPVGEILRRARLQMGQSIEYVEQVLRIRAAHLIALEESDHASLPGRVYTIGFVRTYSDYLGLSGEKMVALLKNQALGRTKKPEYNFPVAADDASIPSQKIMLMAGAAIIVFVVGLIFVFSGGDEAQNAIPPVPAEIKQEAAQAAAPPKSPEAPPETAVAAPAAPPAPVPAPVQPEGVTVRAVENSWLEIKNGQGQIVFGQILKEDQELKIPNEPGYVMTTGNAGGIDILIGDQALPKLGKTGDVRRNVTLDINALQKLMPASGGGATP